MKRTLCLFLVILLGMLAVFPVMAAENESVITPRYSYIKTIYSDLQIGSLGMASCQANCYASAGDSVVLTAKLQQYNGSSWTTLKTWTATGDNIASLSKNYWVYSGYTYRLSVTCAVYNTSGVLVESGTCYSHQVVY